MDTLTWSKDGKWGIEDVDLSTLPPKVYAALWKLKELEHGMATNYLICVRGGPSLTAAELMGRGGSGLSGSSGWYVPEPAPEPKPPKRTNWDRLGDMDLDEFASTLGEECGCPATDDCDGTCHDCWKRWLEKEVTEDVD